MSFCFSSVSDGWLEIAPSLADTNLCGCKGTTNIRDVQETRRIFLENLEKLERYAVPGMSKSNLDGMTDRAANRICREKKKGIADKQQKTELYAVLKTA